MPFAITCPNCRSTLTAGNELIGQRVACPTCSNSVFVAAPAPPRIPQAAALSPAGKDTEPPLGIPIWLWGASGAALVIVLVLFAMMFIGGGERPTAPIANNPRSGPDGDAQASTPPEHPNSLPARSERLERDLKINWKDSFDGFRAAVINLEEIKKGETIRWEGDFVRITREADLGGFDGILTAGATSFEFREIRPKGVILIADSVKIGGQTVHLWFGCSDKELEAWKRFRPGSRVRFTGKVDLFTNVSVRVEPDGSTRPLGFLNPTAVLRVVSVIPEEGPVERR